MVNKLIRIITEKDKNYIIESHCRIYRSEYNFDESFRDFITESVNFFMINNDSQKENIWVLDINGVLKGSIGIVKVSNEIAQLRWFLLESDQRGKGYGKQLVQEAIDFCKANNYETISLWTNTSLTAARKLYELFGFRISETRNQILSNQVIHEERWELNLQR